MLRDDVGRSAPPIHEDNQCISKDKHIIMPDLSFAITTFGSQGAAKKALLIHGLMGTGAVFFKVAERLVKDGYVSCSTNTFGEYQPNDQRVDCPDLLGHGWAPHRETYTIETLAKHLAENLVESYDVIGGVSFGSSVAAALYPLLSTKPKRLVLAEPILDHPPFPQDLIDGAIGGTKNIPTEESILKGNPTWIPAEATLRRMSLTQIDPEAIRQLFQASTFHERNSYETRALADRHQGVNDGKVPHSLLPSAESSKNTEIIIIAADPSMRSVYPASNATKLAAEYPHVKFARRLGATHDMHKDKPDVIYGVLVHGLRTAAELELEVLRV